MSGLYKFCARISIGDESPHIHAHTSDRPRNTNKRIVEFSTLRIIERAKFNARQTTHGRYSRLCGEAPRETDGGPPQSLRALLRSAQQWLSHSRPVGRGDCLCPCPGQHLAVRPALPADAEWRLR